MAKNKPSHEHKRLGTKLKKAREASGLTQGEVVRRLRKSQSYLSKVEAGNRIIDIFELKELAKLYKKKIADLID